MSTDRARAFAKLRYVEPRSVLVELRKAELALARSDLPANIRQLRTNELRPLRELREVCLFCYGWEQIDGQSLHVAHAEGQDYDAVATWDSDTQRHFTPIQLKEVVPVHLNPAASVQGVVDGLQKYVDSEDLTVVIHLNRTVNGFSPDALTIPPLKIAALWVFAAIAADRSRWVIWGNFLEDLRWGEFTYPT
jgi:hypothetical protein